MDEIINKAIFPHRLTAGLGMVLLAIIWSFGWFLAPPDLYVNTEAPMLLMVLNASVLAAWNLVSCVIAAGFFHAASRHNADSFGKYRMGSFRLFAFGVLFLFPVPLMSQVLGPDAPGRALALLITGISLAGIVFGRARIKVISERLREFPVSDGPAASPTASNSHI